MKLYIVSYVIALVVFVAIDFVWLGAMANALYRPTLGDMLAPEFRLAPAIIFYLVYIAGLVFFAVRPGLAAGSVGTALLYGAAFGFVAYATYDLTNQATLKNWSTTLTIADLAWGTALSAVSAGAAQLLTARFAG